MKSIETLSWKNLSALVVFLASCLLVKGEWTTLRPTRDMEYKFDSITRTIKGLPDGGKKAFFTILMQAPNNASPAQSDDRVTWRKLSEGPVNGVSRFEATLNNSVSVPGYRIPKIWLSAGNDEFSFQMNEISSQESQIRFNGNSCQFGVQQKQDPEGKVIFKIMLKNCNSVPYCYLNMTRKIRDTWILTSDYFTQTEEMTSPEDITYRICTVDKAAVQNDGLKLKLEFIFSMFNEKFGEELFEGFMYRYNLMQIK
ncbi:uncharacterized protein LOC133192556 [Saccostrea echinata]|uniref:uncharacterized protein LOC133192455 n=1 Tax=Saccostrea echinata TaxID=191078 RepID=UPI002A8132AC|nr:uncharacterized protein LOC133192455 [Saccostrea echinata]XP_061184533.1 uncharacterized protein LOC133192556 [Saccostrea echinata]